MDYKELIIFGICFAVYLYVVYKIIYAIIPFDEVRKNSMKIYAKEVDSRNDKNYHENTRKSKTTK